MHVSVPVLHEKCHGFRQKRDGKRESMPDFTKSVTKSLKIVTLIVKPCHGAMRSDSTPSPATHANNAILPSMLYNCC